MAKKVVSFSLHKTKKNKQPIKNGANKRKKLKIAFKKIIDYMKSDTYMFAPLLNHPQSSLPSTFSSSGEPIREKEKSELFKGVEDYLNYDSYMYAPIAKESVSDTEIHPSGEGKADTGKASNQIESRTEETTLKDANILNNNRSTEMEVDEICAPKTPVVVKRNLLQRETIKHVVVHQNCLSSSLQGKALLQKKQRKIVVE
ncbi:hypothetical protein ACP275_10G138000 [Erythranthe tilingii]